MTSVPVELALYIVYTLPVFVIAQKSGHPLAWLAFIPFANIWLMCDLTDLSLAFALVWLIPFIGAIIFTVVVWMRLAENTNKPEWLGLLMVIPIVNLITGYYIAFVDTGGFVA